MHLAIGLCLFAKESLKMIPVPVLFGIILYFGIVSLSGTQLYERVKLIFIPSKYCPNVVYARGVCGYFIWDLHFILKGPNNNNKNLYLGSSIKTQSVHIYSSFICYNFTSNQIVQYHLLFVSNNFGIFGASSLVHFAEIFHKQRVGTTWSCTWNNWRRWHELGFLRVDSFANMIILNSFFFYILLWCIFE